MNFWRLKDLVRPLYQNNAPGHRYKQMERIECKALSWAEQCSDDISQINLDCLRVLGCLITIKDKVLPDMNLRAAIEACFIEAGWTPVSIKNIWRTLEKIPKRPNTIESKLVTDAQTYYQLGLLGLIRNICLATHKNRSLEEGLRASEQALHRQIFTTIAKSECQKMRIELQETLVNLRNQLRSKTK